MRKFQLLYIIFIFPLFLFSQNKISKSRVEKIFKSSQVEVRNGKFSLPSDKAWQFNNSDSLYFKLDTLTAIRHKTSKEKSLCEVVDWTFYTKKAFILGKESNCKEPPIRWVEKYPEDYFTIAVYNSKSQVIIDILRYDKMIIESFIVIEIQDTKDYTKVKLARRFNNY